LTVRALLRRVVPRAARVHASALIVHASALFARRRSARLEADLAAMVRSGAPIVAGPWLGEVGFELLYWVPFLAWFAERFAVEPERLTVISRGGTSPWYAGFAAGYVDVFDTETPDSFKAEHDARVAEIGEQKQTRPRPFERRIVNAVAKRRQGAAPAWLHPSRMYEAFNPYWWGHLPVEWVHLHARYRPWPRPQTRAMPLPESYVAVKFYFNECFPPTAENRAFVRAAQARLARGGPVVALSTGLNIDDHHGDRIDEDGVMHLPDGIDPAVNLALQSAVVAGARAFVGTYGGFSYLAPFYRVPSTAFYSDAAGFSPRHLETARSAFDRIGSGGLLQVHDVGEGIEAIDRAGARRG
jgi:hypothetical protein